MIPLTANENLIAGIIRKRLERAAADAGRWGVDPHSVFFNGTDMTLPNSDEHRTWDTFITKSSRDRPRDAIQLIKNMIDCVPAGAPPLIGSAEAGRAMKVYSSERVDDISNEFSLDCKNIREIINTFSDINFEVDFETLRAHLLSIPSIGSTTIRGVLLKPQVEADAISILALLHEAGFINPRFPDSTKPRRFRHLLYRDDLNFVKMANWNGMQSAAWEVHPAFRTYLMGIHDARMARGKVSLPP